mgnify:CR=1 FL=1
MQKIANKNTKKVYRYPFMEGGEKTSKDISEIVSSLERNFAKYLENDEARYKNYLQIMARFHNYSVNNSMLIFMQRPNATYISSFSGWKSIGRKVKKGEKGIRIIAPVTIKVRQKSDEENQESPEEQEKLVAFRFAYVFDLEQTEGKELPFLSAAELTGKVPDYSKLMSAIRKISPVSIHYENLEATVKGYYDLTAKEIIIRSGMSELHTVKTALHEITHVLLHSDRNDKNSSFERETEAESVAYVVCNALGLDTAEYSFPYLTSWSQEHTPKELKSSLFLVRKTADSIINQLIIQLEPEQHMTTIE